MCEEVFRRFGLANEPAEQKSGSRGDEPASSCGWIEPAGTKSPGTMASSDLLAG